MTDPDVRPRMSAPDVLAVRFAVTRLDSGYCIEQVDEFVGRVAGEIGQLHEEIARLTEERDSARRELDALR